MPQSQMASEADLARASIVVDWCNFMREGFENWFEAHSGEIGGIDANGDAIVVEKD